MTAGPEPVAASSTTGYFAKQIPMQLQLTQAAALPRLCPAIGMHAECSVAPLLRPICCPTPPQLSIRSAFACKPPAPCAHQYRQLTTSGARPRSSRRTVSPISHIPCLHSLGGTSVELRGSRAHSCSWVCTLAWAPAPSGQCSWNHDHAMLMRIAVCVTRRKQHRPGIASNDNTMHVPTARSSANLTKPNHTPTRHTRAKDRIIPQIAVCAQQLREGVGLQFGMELNSPARRGCGVALPVVFPPPLVRGHT